MILDALGEVDYGIYNVVGGLSVSFIFFSSSLTNSTQRFLTYELGRGQDGDVKRVFSFSLLLYSLIAMAVLVVGLTVGGWYVTHKLVVPPEQIGAAKIVLFTSIVTLAFSFIFSVFESALIARENMKIYAYIGLIDALARLALAYTLLVVNNRLVFYAWAMLVVQLTPRLIMALYCRRQYPEASFSWTWDKRLFREMFGFTGW
ncbi:MAG: lipopolysaccharide biosynthesis protein, partial [Duncaniella sp.]|nr:lipopolysaccharide biosynthesis protein [Duncaniella sp.]